MADDYDENLDWSAPKKVYGDDITVVDPELGVVPFWKSLLWNTAKLREAIRNDAMDVTPLREEEQPPKLAADRRDEDEEKEADAAWLKAVEDAVARLDQRLAMLEIRKKAEQALLDAEAEIEQTLPREGDGTVH